jgi:hypothetical protein
LNITLAVSLVESVLSSEPDSTTWSDLEFWIAVFDLVSWIKTATPPTAFEKSISDTPLRSSSASQRGNEQKHDQVDLRILEELAGRVYYDVGGLHERDFEEKAWTNNARDTYEKSRAQRVARAFASRFDFKWFMKFPDNVFSGLGRRYYTSANKVLRASEADRKLDIFLTPTDAALQTASTTGQMYLSFGEHKQNPDEDRSTKALVQMAGYTREVFGSQPDRRFVPGFTICGSLMRL